MMNKPRKIASRMAGEMAQGVVVAEFGDYHQAVNFVDKLVKSDFPVAQIAIVGSDLRSVERVRVKLSYAKLALSGATTGSWVGLLFGLLFFSAPADGSMVTGNLIQALFIGAGLGMLFNVVRYSLAKNKRTWLSQSQIVAKNYQVQVPADLAAEAKLKAAASND
jgi:hypothetical protein